MKNIDWKEIWPVLAVGGLVATVAGVALGAFVVKPQMDKTKAKKQVLALKKDAKSGK